MKPAANSNANARGDSDAFTRIELLAVLVALVVLVLALLPALARSRVESQATLCLNNLRRLTQVWMMYSTDNHGNVAANRDLFPPNPDYESPPSGVANRARWAGGSMNGASVGAPYSGLDATNPAILIDPMFTSLASYVKKPALYRCPADRSTWAGVARVRSYSMNGAVGPAYNGTREDPDHAELGHWLTGGTGPGPWRTYIRESDLVAPVPSQLLLLLEEHPNSINDAAFAFRMPLNPLQTYWVDLPAPVHNRAAGMSFADGHVEMHRWLAPLAIPSVVWAADTVPNIGNQIQSVPNDPDVLWLAHRISAPMPGASIYYPGP